MIARTATGPADIGGHTVEAGDKVLISWMSANRDEAEFEHPDAFDLDRATNRHIAFGAGPHRCAGSNLARMNLRVAVEALTRRLGDLHLKNGAEPIEFDSAYSRAPVAVPIAFTPGPRVGA
jgi:cytochrome P450